MLFAPFSCTHPPPPVPPFLLAQNLSLKNIVSSDITSWKLYDAYNYASIACNRLTACGCMYNGHVINVHWACDQCTLGMWSMYTGHVINVVHWACDQCTLGMWSMCTGHVINVVHWACDQCTLGMWSMYTGHVINVHWACDQCGMTWIFIVPLA